MEKNLKNIDKYACVCVYLVTKLCPILCDPMDCSPARLLCLWVFSGKNTGSGCHFLLQGTFSSEGLNPHLLHWQADSQLQNHQGIPEIHMYTHIHMYIYAAKSLQSRPTLCDPIDGSPPGSPVPGILQARTLEWVAISFSNA